MTLCTMSTSCACPWTLQPNQPDDVLTFSKNHLCVYKELPWLHNTLMHMPASAWIFGSKSILLYLLLRRHWPLGQASAFVGFLPSTLLTIGTNTIHFASSFSFPTDDAFQKRWFCHLAKAIFEEKFRNAWRACLNCTLRVYRVVHGFFSACIHVEPFMQLWLPFSDP